MMREGARRANSLMYKKVALQIEAAKEAIELAKQFIRGKEEIRDSDFMEICFAFDLDLEKCWRLAKKAIAKEMGC